jgi:hypothetical protein
MVALKHAEMRILDDALAMGGGYVLDFSDRTFAEFFDDEFDIAIYSEKYAFNGTSKAKHMRAFITTEDEYTVAHVLRRFWERRESIPLYVEAENREPIKRRFFDLLVKIEGGAAAPRHSSARNREPGRPETYLQAAAGSHRHFRLVKVSLWTQSRPR